MTIDSAGELSAKTSLRQKSGIEVFLSDLGVGLLSMSVRVMEIPDLVWRGNLCTTSPRPKSPHPGGNSP